MVFGAVPTVAKASVHGGDSTISSPSEDPIEVAGKFTHFPSLEIWQYQDGEEPVLIYGFDAPASSVFGGTLDINRMVTIDDN